MTIIRKILTLCGLFVGLFVVVGFAQETEMVDEWNNEAYVVNQDAASQDSIAAEQNSSQGEFDNSATDTAGFATETGPGQATPPSEEPTEKKKARSRNKITYAEYQALNGGAKKRSRTLHHGLTVSGARYIDKRYGRMDHDADWGSGMGLYYFYRHYYGRYLGFQYRFGGLYRYSRWNFDEDPIDGELDNGRSYKLIPNTDRKYHNFALDVPITAKLGHHIKGTTAFIYMSATLDITKPIFEMVDTENRLYLKSLDGASKSDIKTASRYGDNPFPLYESHQTNDAFHFLDWEGGLWLGTGIESRLVAIEFQVYGVGGATRDHNHRYHHLGHDADFNWRLLLDFSIR